LRDLTDSPRCGLFGQMMTMDIKVLGCGDEAVLSRVADGVFDNPIEDDLVRECLADPRHHLVVGLDKGIVVGFVSAVHYVHPDKRPQMWIHEVGVAPTHRRQGLARSLLEALLEVARAHQCTDAWVLTDRSNMAAMALYSSLGGIEGVNGSGPVEAMLGYTFALAGLP